ncbi:MAG: hypothetical protein IPM13_05625 [Phycisphaerales bacterium]|nr:hypothetical protein [Phycisphaerales bacterium]
MRALQDLSSRRFAGGSLAALLAIALLVGCNGDPTPVIGGSDVTNTGSSGGDSTGVPFVPAVAGEFVDASPAAGDMSVAAYPGIPVTIALSGNGGTSALQFHVSSAPSAGSLGTPTKTGASTASITYTAPLNFSGPVSFSYQVDDGARRSAPATVRINVYPRIYFTLDRYEGAAPLTVVGRIATVNGEPLPSGEYRWDWAGVEDSGPVLSQAQRAHTFSQPGVYAVALTVVLNGLAGPVSCSHTPSKDTDRAQIAVGGNTVTISGRVLRANGQPMAGITVGIGGTLISTTTDAQGNYALTVATGWSGSVRPLADGFSFQPESRTFGVLNGSQGGQDFTGHASVAPEGVLAVVPADPFSPSGPQGGPFAPNQVEYQVSNVGTAAVEWTATASHGWLSVSPGSGVLVPGGAAVVAVALTPAVNSFAPGTYPAEVIFANITNGLGNESRGVSLTVTPPPTYVISGTVTLDGGGDLAGVTLGGLPGNPMTNASGYFSASVPAGWSGLVVPSKDGYTFAPASRSYATVSANQPGQNFVASVSAPGTASSVSQYGITWTFSQPRPVGQFVNGDWWVVGPVTITAVDPAPTGTGADFRNGSQVNPKAGQYQGFDGAALHFDPNLPAVFPLVLQAGQSLVSTIGRPLDDPNMLDILNIGRSGASVRLRTAAVLTCLAAPVPATMLRPPYCGNEKPLFDSAALRMDLLPTLAPTSGWFFVNSLPPGTSRGAQFARYFQRPWIMTQANDWCALIKPVENQTRYYRESHTIESEAALLLCLDPNCIQFGPGDKQKLVINFVQYGIDSHYVAKSFGGNEGDRCLSKWPGVFAGIMLDHAEMRSANNGHHSFKTEALLYRGTGWTGATALYSSRENALDTHEQFSPFDNNNWCQTDPGGNNGFKNESYRRTTHSHTWVGTALAARLMNATGYWNNDVFFDYIDRWMTEDDSAYYDALMQLSMSAPCGGGPVNIGYPQRSVPFSQFTKNMWNAYR